MEGFNSNSSYLHLVKNIVLSSRIRLARNINKIPFPVNISKEKAKDLIKDLEQIVSNEELGKYKIFHLWTLDDISLNSLFENHIISSNLIKNKDKAAVIVDDDMKNSIMVNEEDHVRIQSISDGCNLDMCFSKVNEIDDAIENKVKYAFDEKLGYLTACPTNIGTGMRASVMLHLPALTINNEIPVVLNALSQVGMTLRGMYGEESKVLGNLYQVSNQVTLGIHEKEIIENLKVITQQIINEEANRRNSMIKNYMYELKDKIYRSLAVLKNSQLLDNNECLKFLSNVRFGIEMGIIENISCKTIDELIVNTQPYSLKKHYNKAFNEREESIYRSLMVRKILEN